MIRSELIVACWWYNRERKIEIWEVSKWSFEIKLKHYTL